MPAAARVGDDASPDHEPDVLGPGPGSDDVEIEGEPAWRAIADRHACATPVNPPHGAEICFLGSLTVSVNGFMAVRQGDLLVSPTAPDPNRVLLGAASVDIGDLPQGLWAPDRATAFCKALCEIEANWDNPPGFVFTPMKSFSPEAEEDRRLLALRWERQRLVGNAVNDQLTQLGIPPVSLESWELSPNTLGQFKFTDWSLELQRGAFSGDTFEHDVFITLYHEMRHTEQNYALVRSRLSTGLSVDDVSKELGIPQHVVEQGAQSILQDPDAFPGSHDDMLGRMMYTSMWTQEGRGVPYLHRPEEVDARRVMALLETCRCPDPEEDVPTDPSLRAVRP